MLKKNLFSMTIALVILFLSFTGSGTFSNLNLPHIPYLDKIVHAVMYFALMFGITFENRNIPDTRKKFLVLGSIPVLFGGLIEIMQSMFTTTRSGDILDFFADIAGVILAAGAWMLVRRFFQKKVR